MPRVNVYACVCAAYGSQFYVYDRLISIRRLHVNCKSRRERKTNEKLKQLKCTTTYITSVSDFGSTSLTICIDRIRISKICGASTTFLNWLLHTQSHIWTKLFSFFCLFVLFARCATLLIFLIFRAKINNVENVEKLHYTFKVFPLSLFCRCTKSRVDFFWHLNSFLVCTNGRLSAWPDSSHTTVTHYFIEWFSLAN